MKEEHKKGTYVGLRVLNPSSKQLYEFCQQNGILVNQPTFERRLHTTVLYSRKPCPGVVVDPSIHTATFEDFALFTNSKGEDTVLVVKLNAPSVVARHLKLMAEHGGTFDYPVFVPHVTLSQAFYGNINKIPPIDFTIYLGYEYIEELDED